MDNRQTLTKLLNEGRIRVLPCELFSHEATPRACSFDRVEGMMLGLAVGDALGITTEGMRPAHRTARYREGVDYLPNRYTHLRKGYPSNDTQLAYWTVDQLIAEGARSRASAAPIRRGRQDTRDRQDGRRVPSQSGLRRGLV